MRDNCADEGIEKLKNIGLSEIYSDDEIAIWRLKEIYQGGNIG